MGTKFNTPELQEAYNAGREVGKLEGILHYQQIILKNVKNDYEKIFQKKLELENSKKKD